MVARGVAMGKQRFSSLRFVALLVRRRGLDAEKSQNGFALRDLTVRAQTVVIRRQWRLAPMFDDDNAIFGEQVVLRDTPHNWRVEIGAVRRIEIDNVELRLFGREVFQRPKRVTVDHSVIFPYPAIAEILTDDSSGFER